MQGCVGLVVVFFVVVFGIAACLASQMPDSSPECQQWVDYGSVPENDQGLAWEMMQETC